MTNIKKTLKTAGIWCLVATILSLITLFTDIYLFEFYLYNVIVSSMEILLSVITGIIYLCYSRKTKESILKHKNLFFVLAIINIFNNLIVWFLAFWVQMTINREIRTIHFKTMFNMSNNSTHYNRDEDNSDVIVIDEDDYEIKHNAETLTSELEELKSLRDKNLITEEEYERLRQETLRKFMSNN